LIDCQGMTVRHGMTERCGQAEQGGAMEEFLCRLSRAAASAGMPAEAALETIASD
jgi:hypothetical protein